MVKEYSVRVVYDDNVLSTYGTTNYERYRLYKSSLEKKLQEIADKEQLKQEYKIISMEYELILKLDEKTGFQVLPIKKRKKA